MTKQKFMDEALNISLKSNDPNTKVGCVIIKDDKVISSGYNCLEECHDINDFPLNIRDGAYFNTKYPFMLHSEAMAIIDAKQDLNEASMYVTLFPCHECAKLIIRSGIKEIIYYDDKYAHTDSVHSSKKMLESAGVVFKKYK